MINTFVYRKYLFSLSITVFPLFLIKLIYLILYTQCNWHDLSECICHLLRFDLLCLGRLRKDSWRCLRRMVNPLMFSFWCKLWGSLLLKLSLSVCIATHYVNLHYAKYSYGCAFFVMDIRFPGQVSNFLLFHMIFGYKNRRLFKSLMHSQETGNCITFCFYHTLAMIVPSLSFSCTLLQSDPSKI